LNSEQEKKEKLKEKLRKLEETELEYVSRLKKTVINKQQEFENFKTNSLSATKLETINDAKLRTMNRSVPPKQRSAHK